MQQTTSSNKLLTSFYDYLRAPSNIKRSKTSFKIESDRMKNNSTDKF